MKSISIAVFMAVAGFVQANESENCASAVYASASFMTATYGGNFSDVAVQILSVKKDMKSQLVADVITGAGDHKCALKLSPVSPRKDTRDICQWSIQIVSCDSPAVMKQAVIDEPFWIAHKASAKAVREGMRHSIEKLQKSTNPAEDTEAK
jgi:hypothetical protein